MWVKKIFFIGISTLSLTILVGCSSTEKNSTGYDNKKETIIDTNVAAKLMVNNCYSCHAVNATKENRIAPPMSHIKEHYKDEHGSKPEFIKAMTDFVNSPNSDDAIMHGAIAKFGIMPNMQFAKQDVSQIVEYLYENTIDTDEWLTKHSKTNTPTFASDDYIGLGRHIVMSTKKQLGKNLKKTIKNKGTKTAVTFCNLKAMPILDSMALVHNATINRVSNKARNASNISNTKETEMILNYQTQLNNGEDLKPIVLENNDFATFYMPIVTNEMCLKCHGNTNSIETETLAEIKRLYPTDLAVGYDVNQIRGVWRVEIKK